MDSKIARKKYSLIKILENFAIRKSYGFGNLLNASPETIAQYIETIRTNMSLKTEDDKRNGELTGVLTLLKKFLENSEKEQQNAKEIALLQPTISGIAPDTMPHNLKDASIPPQQNLEQTPLEKLRRRIAREFEKCTYIGDISISDEEYGLLMPPLQTDYQTICQNHNHIIIDPLFAVGLVQIGIRYYDGRFWSHVQKELKLEKLPMNHQGWIGKSFYKTLIRFGKFHVAENEFMNNILLHCFITKHYANDLFDFLFAYYQIDLERDLSRNSAEMRKYLMQTMSKGESSARAYKIKKHTADAVSANERGCKIRVGRILRFMDNALFNDLYPENSQNRIAQLFCEWAKSSGRFEYARRATAGLTRKGEKRFSTPFIHFDTKREKFYLVLPQQYIHLNAEDDIPQMYWRIRIENFENILEVSSDSCVTGCKTEKIDCFEVPADRLLQEIEIELLKDSGDRAKRFLLKSASIRFFDNDWDMIDSVTYTKYLPEGQVYAFTDPDGVLQTDSDAIDGFEKSLGYGLYTLTLQKGDVLRLPGTTNVVGISSGCHEVFKICRSISIAAGMHIAWTNLSIEAMPATCSCKCFGVCALKIFTRTCGIFAVGEKTYERKNNEGKTLADSMVRGIHMMLHEALDAAVKERLIVRNPTNGTTVPKPNYPDKQVLDDGQLEKFLGMIEAYPDWRDFFYTECMTRLRHPSAVYHRFQKILERANCKRVRFHDLRHTFATMALENGMDIKTLSAIIGHVSAETTLNIYSHITDTMQQQAAARIDREIAGADTPIPEPNATDKASDSEADNQPTEPKFEPYKGKIRKPGTGCVTMINDHLYEGRFSPRVNGKRIAKNIYATTREECEEKLKTLIAEMKKEIAEIKAGK